MNQADESGDSQASTPNQSPVKPVAQPSQATTSKCQRQLEFLQNRHEEFKKAAIQARDNGNKQEAMSFMKTMKAIQDMINHTKNGLPCDIRNESQNTPRGAAPGSRDQRWVNQHRFRRSILKSAMMLTEFETECEIRKVIPLLANKKPVAKIQVRVRLREPMEKAQVVEEEIQWAVLDSVKAKKPAAQKPAANTSASSKKPDLPKMKPKSVLKYEISVELGFAEKAKQLRNREKIEQHTQKLQSLQDELSRTREYAKSHPSNYKLICANYVERCMSFLNMAQEQGWTDRIAEVSAKIQHSKGELATLS
ncbi:unnamed protein product [Oikopleura dioica]|uniref:DM14 domain-containing protein n=1 Tax=Oikopleura dioica TaxID=34765 RepID=E4XCA1_OIKDI|nr:unnamed protein product [Oikopleura dioica]